jgi:hypothetical protein
MGIDLSPLLVLTKNIITTKAFEFSQVELDVGGEDSYRCPRDARGFKFSGS